MRNGQSIHLWILWGVWGNLLIAYLFLPSSILTWMSTTMLWTTVCFVIAMYYYSWAMKLPMFKTNKKQSSSLAAETILPINTHTLIEGQASGTKEELLSKETLIARGAILTGEISNESDVLVEGTVIGNIKSTRSIRIGKEGKVEGTLLAEKITINGTLIGQCQAHAVKILSQGRVDGDIQAGELAIESGGTFNGNSRCSGERVTGRESKSHKKPAGEQPTSEASHQRGIESVRSNVPSKIDT